MNRNVDIGSSGLNYELLLLFVLEISDYFIFCLEMSAAEFKTYLKSKGRVDPRIAQVDMRQKFQMFQDM